MTVTTEMVVWPTVVVTFACSKLSQVVKFTCWLLTAGSLTAGVKSVVAIIVRLIGPVS